MSNPSRARDHRRQRILESASHVFAQNDYAAVSMGAVARRAKVSRGTVYNYFGSKDRLYRDVILQLFGALMTRLEEISVESRSPAEALDHCVVEAFLFFVRYPNLLLLWRREELKRLAVNGGRLSVSDNKAESNEPIGSEVANMAERLAGLVCGVVAAGVRSGAFRVVNPAAAASVILGAVEGLAGSVTGRMIDRQEESIALEELAGLVRQSLSEGVCRRTG